MLPSIRLVHAHCMSAHVINNINTSDPDRVKMMQEQFLPYLGGTTC